MDTPQPSWLTDYEVPSQTSRQVILYKVLPIFPRISKVEVGKSHGNTCPQNSQTVGTLVVPGERPLWKKRAHLTVNDGGSFMKMATYSFF